jgi:hypothetical protein
MNEEGYSHSEHTILHLLYRVPELQEEQRHEKGDEAVHEKTGENIIRTPPQRNVVALHDSFDLVQKRGCI